MVIFPDPGSTPGISTLNLIGYTGQVFYFKIQNGFTVVNSFSSEYFVKNFKMSSFSIGGNK